MVQAWIGYLATVALHTGAIQIGSDGSKARLELSICVMLRLVITDGYLAWCAHNSLNVAYLGIKHTQLKYNVARNLPVSC